MNEFSKKPADSGHHWISISDMMSGLMMVFLFIAVSYMIDVDEQKKEISDKNEKVDKIVSTYEDTQKYILRDLQNLLEELKKDNLKWGVEIDGQKLLITFNSKDKVPFEQNSYEISDEFKTEVLEKFVPKYFNILYKYKDSVEEIKIEGHSSEEGKNENHPDPEGDYLYNMKLSHDRARSVLEYILNLETGEMSKKRDWIRKNVTASGLSSSRLVKGIDKKDTQKKSRRVEFRVKTNADTQIMKIIEELK